MHRGGLELTITMSINEHYVVFEQIVGNSVHQKALSFNTKLYPATKSVLMPFTMAIYIITSLQIVTLSGK